MTEVPGFLLELGLRADADERAVRRAYAVQLKQLDQAAQPLQFQQLREAYEAALHWARQARDSQEAEAAQAPPPPPAPPEAVVEAAPEPAPPPVPAELRPDPVRDILVALDTRLQQAPLRSVPEATALLEHTLEDARLLDMDARFLFEANIAHLLACGWRPGHEHLFEAALVLFDWRTDSARLLRLGQAGQVVDRAIVEQDAQGQQAPDDRDAQRHYLELLRRTADPGPQALALGLGRVMHAAATYPTWLRLTMDISNIEAWREHEATLSRGTLQSHPSAASAHSGSISASRLTVWFAIFFVGVLVFALLKALVQSGNERTATAPPAVSAPAPTPSLSALPQDPSAEHAAARARTLQAAISGGTGANAIPGTPRPALEPDPPAARYTVPPQVVYPPMSRRLGEQGLVVLRVMVNSTGAIADATVLRGSGFDRLDKAALDAVRLAQAVPLRRADGRTVAAWYTAPFHFRLDDGAKPREAAAATTVTPDAQPPARTRSYGERVTAAVRPHILFAKEVAGNPLVEYTLDLAPDGAITAARLSKASGVPEWDAAALRAIQRTARMPLDDQGKVPTQMVLALRPKLQ